MTLRDFFKKVPETELDRRQSLRDTDQILAWLEELHRLGTVVELECSDSDLTPVQAKVRTVVEEAGICSFAFKWKPVKELIPGQRVRLVFAMDRQRFQADLVYQGRGNYLEYRFGLPTAIYRAERRDSVRVKMRPRDELTATVLQGFFEGLGLTGTLLDLSRGGCSLALRQAIQIKDQKRLAINANLLLPGTPLVLVRLPNLPHLAQVECGGFLCSIRPGCEGVIVGLRFEGMGVPETMILNHFLHERDPGIPFAFPRKRRFSGLEENEGEILLASGPSVEPAPPAEAGGKEEDLPPIASEVDSGPKEGLSESEVLKRVQKRGKKILLVMADELERITFLALLQNDGYQCMFEAQSLVQALEHHRRVPLDLVVVDQAVGHVGALKVLEVLRENGLPKEVPKVVIQKSIDHQLTLANKGGKLHLLIVRPLDFFGTLKHPLETLLGL